MHPVQDDTNSYEIEVYSIRVKDTRRPKAWYTARWKMTKQEAATHFANTAYEVMESTKEVRRVWKRGCAPIGLHDSYPAPVTPSALGQDDDG